MVPTPPDTDQSSNASPQCVQYETGAGRQPSPAPSVSTLTSLDAASIAEQDQSSLSENQALITTGTTAEPPPAKRRKLTTEEREQQKRGSSEGGEVESETGREIKRTRSEGGDQSKNENSDVVQGIQMDAS